MAVANISPDDRKTYAILRVGLLKGKFLKMLRKKDNKNVHYRLKNSWPVTGPIGTPSHMNQTKGFLGTVNPSYFEHKKYGTYQELYDDKYSFYREFRDENGKFRFPTSVKRLGVHALYGFKSLVNYELESGLENTITGACFAGAGVLVSRAFGGSGREGAAIGAAIPLLAYPFAQWMWNFREFPMDRDRRARWYDGKEKALNKLERVSLKPAMSNI